MLQAFVKSSSVKINDRKEMDKLNDMPKEPDGLQPDRIIKTTDR